ncbi:MAG: hypothetical protein QOK42_2625 [Frankiaceae bacterium]|nr:hypothetical protein [Frankiaceae bacterium]
MNARTVTALLCAAALGALAPTATAAPVEQRRIATTELHLGLAGGRTLDVQLRLLTGPSGSTLRVETARCDANGCDAASDYAGPVSGASISGTDARATLHSVVGGLALSLTWTPSGEQAHELGGLRGSGNGGEDDLSVYSGSPALVAAQVESVACHLTGVVGDEVHVSDSSGPAAGVRPLTALNLPRRATVIC